MKMDDVVRMLKDLDIAKVDYVFESHEVIKDGRVLSYKLIITRKEDVVQ